MYNKEVDMWSLGVILFTCLAGRLPFTCNDKYLFILIADDGDSNATIYNIINTKVEFIPCLWEDNSYEGSYL